MIRLTLAAALIVAAVPAFAQRTPAPATPVPVSVTSDPTAFLAANRAKKGVVETPSGLQYQQLFAGEPGAKPGDSDVALVIYEGKLTDGSTCDKSPWFVPMPVAAVVPGFAEALKLMPRGARYRFWIKPELGYGPAEQKDGSGKVIIPANAVLVFDVRLLDFIPGATYQALVSGAPPSGN